jgi:hypothetical protein
MKPQEQKNRRDFFNGMLRWLALGGIVGGAAGLISKSSDGDRKLACINDANCRTCSKCCKCEFSNYSSPECGPECKSKKVS